MTSRNSEPTKGGQPQQDDPSDGAGRGIIDPTKNVLDLVKAESKYQDGMRDGLETIQNFAREAESKFQNGMRDSETKRIDQLAALRQDFQNTIRDMLAKSVESTQSLVASQLLGIQATFDSRVSKLEQFRWESGGRSSVNDPAITEAVTRMTLGLANLKTTQDDALVKIASTNAEAIAKLTASIATMGVTEGVTRGKGMGRGEVFAWLCAAVVAGGGIATFIGFLVRLAR